MTARDEVAALPGGAGEGVANTAKPVYTADPGSITGLADDLTKAAGTAEGSVRSVGTAVADLHTWQGDTANSFRGYMSRFSQAGNAGHGALTAGAAALNEAARTLTEGKTSLEKLFEQVLTDYKNNVAGYGTTAPHPTPAERAEAAEAAVSDNSGAVTGAVNSINAALGTAAGDLRKATSGFSPKFSSLPVPSEAPPASTTPSSYSPPAHGGGGGGGGGLGPSGGPPSSPPPGNVQEWIQEAIKVLEANGVPAGELNASDIWTIIQHESGGNPNAINNWDCVPLSTLILTRRGWRKHDEVRVDDHTIGYEARTGRSRWTRITRVVRHQDAPLVRIGDSRWSATTTPNHRWLRDDNPTEAGLVATADIRPLDRLLLAAPADTPARLDLGVAGAATLGRLAGAGHPRSDAVHQVLAMSTRQRDAWLAAIADAKGARAAQPGHTRPQASIHQAPGTVLDAIALAVYLSGHRPRVLDVRRAADDEGWRAEAVVRSHPPVVTGGFLTSEPVGRADVWCVTTDLGSWTAREDEHIFLTGNSNAQAGHPSKGLMQTIDSTFQANMLPGHGNVYNPVDNIVAGVRYALSRYGSIGNVPGIVAVHSGHAYVGY